jgi:hypothetical protein
VEAIESAPAAEVPQVHSVLLLLGASEGVAPECAASYRYIDQGVVEGYSANPIGAIESNVTNANIEKIVPFLISSLPQFVLDDRLTYNPYIFL